MGWLPSYLLFNDIALAFVTSLSQSPRWSWRDLLWLNYLRPTRESSSVSGLQRAGGNGSNPGRGKAPQARNLALGIIVLAAVVVIAVLSGSEGIVR
jgi:hypothetical protein